MTREEIQTQVETAIKTVLNNPSLDVNPEAKLINDLGIESIDLLDISSELEKSVGRELDFKELAKQASTAGTATAGNLRVMDLVNYLHALVG